MRPDPEDKVAPSGAWDWKPDSDARHHEDWAKARDAEAQGKKPGLPKHLFHFEADRVYHVKVVRSGGRLTLHVDDVEILSEEKPAWADRGKTSDRSKTVRNGTGRIQILTWTPQAIDNLTLSGVILGRYR
jgi:hypothetical protein